MTTDLIELGDSIELDLTGIMTIRATIKSSEPVTLDAVDTIDAITYSLGASLKFGGFFYTVVMIDVDQEMAKEWVDDEREFYLKSGDQELAKTYTWNGNLFESGYWGSPDCALAEDNVSPSGYQDQVEIEYL